ncbi:CPBP family intramembrane metalloprotease [Parvularcula flava]|uniref:Abortive infection protein n=1 Tax=Aquisalinus luteolus TaxID=1566827 RepID=A0A8J3A302_9PROT|nr:CPBP family intramembrane glutamic endopeptidase [Aquisalinus luteolus]NHK28684.1 CPBP family intramembrane metalloprotease [Aquisalinus luteolus]GGH99208.1 abortive infection protein [Aquisalinus luteolus]
MQIILFLIISFAISWTVAGRLYTAGGFEGAGPTAGIYLFVMMTGPAIAALIMTLIYDRDKFFSSLGLSGRSPLKVISWSVIGWVVAIVLVTYAALIAALAGPGFADPAASMAAQLEAGLAAQNIDLEELPMSMEMLVMIQFAVNLPLGILINTFLLTFTEELGWRGWLQPRLAFLGFWPMCLLTGLIWGIWHAPIIVMGYNYPGLPVLGPILMTVFCILLTPYVALMRERGLTWAAGAFHGAINAVAGVSLLFIASSDGWVWNGIMGLGGFIVMAVGCAIIWWWRNNNPAKPISPVREAIPATSSPNDPPTPDTSSSG